MRNDMSNINEQRKKAAIALGKCPMCHTPIADPHLISDLVIHRIEAYYPSGSIQHGLQFVLDPKAANTRVELACGCSLPWKSGESCLIEDLK